MNEFVFQTADFEELCEHHDGGDIGKYRHDEGQSALDALGEAVVYADFLKTAKRKERRKMRGMMRVKNFIFVFLARGGGVFLCGRP